MSKGDGGRGGGQRGGGPKALSAAAAPVTRAVVARRGFAEAGVIAEWPAIVGPALARHTCPLKVSYPRGERGDGTLHLRVASGALATELQHMAPVLIERVNGYFGYRAVARLALSQGPLPRRPARPRPAQPLADPAEVERRLAAVSDPQLKDALAALGRHVLARR